MLQLQVVRRKPVLLIFDQENILSPADQSIVPLSLSSRDADWLMSAVSALHIAFL